MNFSPCDISKVCNVCFWHLSTSESAHPLTIDWHRENGFEWLNKYLTSGHVKVNLISSKWWIELVFPRRVSKLIKLGRVVFLGRRFLRHATARTSSHNENWLKKHFSYFFFIHLHRVSWLLSSPHMIWESCWNIYIGKVFFCSLFQPPKAACCKVAVGEHLQHCPAEPSRNWCFGGCFWSSVRECLLHSSNYCHSLETTTLWIETRLFNWQFFFRTSFRVRPWSANGCGKIDCSRKSLPTLRPASDASSLIHQFHHRWFHILFFLDFADDDTVVGGEKQTKNFQQQMCRKYNEWN